MSFVEDTPSADFSARRIEASMSNGERVFKSAANSVLALGDEPAPSKRQTAAVLRALADRSLNTRMVSDPTDADDLGRYFHFLADELLGTL